MKPQRPYLLRALYDWIVDSDEVPYVLVDARVEGVVVPTEHVKDDQIVLNLSPSAVRGLVFDNDFVMCMSRFDGREFELYLPMASVRAIYCKDNGKGLVFDEDSYSADAGGVVGDSEHGLKQKSESTDSDPDPKKPDPDGSPKLRLV